VSALVGADDADDVTQDTYIRAWRSLPRYRGDASARTWLLVIARRASADAVRSAQRRRRLGLQMSSFAHGEVMDDADRVEIEAVIAGLPQDRREAFVLTQILGCSYADAAAICGVQVGTIRSRVARARADLIAAIDDEATG